MTLYHLTSEKNGAVKCIGQCATFWPPLLWSGQGKPPLGAGVKAAKLGTVKRPNGSTQLTYNKFPLYRYSGDKKAGNTSGEGVADPPGTWYAVSPAGSVVKPASSSTTSGTTDTSTDSTTTDRYGY
jgi:predicted lipoprotein with Yx(FWY)xxD motif